MDVSKHGVFVRSPYNYDMLAASDESALVCSDPSLAVQSGKDDADINLIMKRFGVTGQLPSNLKVPSYGDFSGVTDFQTAMNAVVEAQGAFMKLPPEVRARFGNSPQAFLMFSENPDNLEEMRKMRLTSPEYDSRMAAKAAAVAAAAKEK